MNFWLALEPLPYNSGLGAWGIAKEYGPLRAGSSSEQGSGVVQPSVGVQLSDGVQVRTGMSRWS